MGLVLKPFSVGAPIYLPRLLFHAPYHRKQKSKDDEEIVQDTKGEALSYMGKKAKSEDEVEEEYAESTTL
ncbi:hypothetical protein V501_02707 [Pseudogymnoascus sp. VKM F-4519 (FW-2642)]|nr:hypothetical protein V501_02707 [Pseudogymnoascus sp. VKM F-4519 (FW-2642)]